MPRTAKTPRGACAARAHGGGPGRTAGGLQPWEWRRDSKPGPQSARAEEAAAEGRSGGGGRGESEMRAGSGRIGGEAAPVFAIFVVHAGRWFFLGEEGVHDSLFARSKSGSGRNRPTWREGQRKPSSCLTCQLRISSSLITRVGEYVTDYYCYYNESIIQIQSFRKEEAYSCF
jgi:hypothetical protein